MWIVGVIGQILLFVGFFIGVIAVCNPDFLFREDKEINNDKS